MFNIILNEPPKCMYYFHKSLQHLFQWHFEIAWHLKRIFSSIIYNRIEFHFNCYLFCHYFLVFSIYILFFNWYLLINLYSFYEINKLTTHNRGDWSTINQNKLILPLILKRDQINVCLGHFCQMNKDHGHDFVYRKWSENWLLTA